MSAARPIASPFPLQQADLCVKCGLCLPYCPTYLDQQHEGDSPRGRIALLQGLATAALDLTPRLEQHLDGCLGCRSCERVCPAQVPYGQLLDRGRALLAQQRPERTARERRIGTLLASPRWRAVLRALLALYRGSGLQRLVRRTRLLGRGSLARLESLLPEGDAAALPLSTPGPGMPVSLFTGCAGDLFDRRTLADTGALLSRLGFSVEVPRTQGCCGAIHQHAGELESAAGHARRNLAAFAGEAPVLCTASGCGASLAEYGLLLGDAAGGQFGRRVQDLSAYLLRHWPQDAALRPLRARVALHTPCTLRNVLRGDGAVRALLAKIPQVELVELAGGACCGAAGSHFITRPQAADRLLQGTLDAVSRVQPDLIVSSNVGCALHVAAGLRRRGAAPEVLHPASLLLRQLG